MSSLINSLFGSLSQAQHKLDYKNWIESFYLDKSLALGPGPALRYLVDWSQEYCSAAAHSEYLLLKILFFLQFQLPSIQLWTEEQVASKDEALKNLLVQVTCQSSTDHIYSKRLCYFAMPILMRAMEEQERELGRLLLYNTILHDLLSNKETDVAFALGIIIEFQWADAFFLERINALIRQSAPLMPTIRSRCLCALVRLQPLSLLSLPRLSPSLLAHPESETRMERFAILDYLICRAEHGFDVKLATNELDSLLSDLMHDNGQPNTVSLDSFFLYRVLCFVHCYRMQLEAPALSTICARMSQSIFAFSTLGTSPTCSRQPCAHVQTEPFAF